MIRMIVTDLDETLFRTDKTISEYTINTIKSIRNKGIKIIFATARGVSSNEIFHNNFNDMFSSEDDLFYWVVRLKNNNEFIGLVSLERYHDGTNREISYQFKPMWWGKGYAEEVPEEFYKKDEMIQNENGAIGKVL